MRISTLGISSKKIADCGPMTPKGRSMRPPANLCRAGTLRRLRIAEIKKKTKLKKSDFKSPLEILRNFKDQSPGNLSLRNAKHSQDQSTRNFLKFQGADFSGEFRNPHCSDVTLEQNMGTGPKSQMKAGFTFLELSLVILLIGIILSLVLPNVGIHKSKLEKERQIEKVSQTIKSAYDLSQIRNQEIILLFDLDENKFQVVAFNGEEEEPLQPEKRLNPALKIKDVVNSKGDKIAAGKVPLIFNPDGFVEPAAIHFVDKDAKFYTLFINPLTGQSRIEDGYWEEE